MNDPNFDDTNCLQLYTIIMFIHYRDSGPVHINLGKSTNLYIFIRLALPFTLKQRIPTQITMLFKTDR